MMENLEKYNSVFVVYDKAVQMFAYMDVICALPPEKFRAKMAFDASAQSKTLASVEKICRWLLSEGADRHSLVIAVGGGTTTDTVGFAASVYMRGIDCAYVPTTLLAQVDAAIGGKTGVNLDGYKNMVGTFTMPVFVRISTKPLGTLPKKQILEGGAELLKTFIIDNSGDNYRKAVDAVSGIVSGSRGVDSLEELIAAAGAVKAGIVERDFREGGERRKLNLGHTFAHAIECLSEGGISHGEAVAMGIVLAAELAVKEGVAQSGLPEMIENDFIKCGLRTGCPYTVDQLRPFMSRDKKSDAGTVAFVLPCRIGEVEIMDLNIDRI